MYIFFFCSLFLSAVLANNFNPKVAISDGELQGSIMKTRGGRAISAFQGIPYAEPPLGELRFKAPVPIKRWEGILDATKPPEACPQQNFFNPSEIIGEEDCLYLNVYTPQLPHETSKLLPVIVYIHGGAFICGSSRSDYLGPEYLLDRNFVLVTLNYRLGALGFLSTNDNISPGNYGLKDQSLTLKWVKKNIKQFGGDPDSVTVAGISAGGSSAHYQMLSPLNKGLFKGIISQSGSSLCVWSQNTKEENIKNAEKLAKHFGCPTDTSSELVECLKKVEVSKLVEASDIFNEWEASFTIPFRPTVEPPSTEAFLTDTPANLLNSGNFNDVPLLTGLTKDEGILLAARFVNKPELYDQLNEDFNNKITSALAYKQFVTNSDIVTEKIKKFYFGDKKKLTMENSFRDLINVYGDALFGKCFIDAVLGHLKVSKHPVYAYLFAKQGSISFSDFIGGKEKYGVSHGDDVMYLFPSNLYIPVKNETESERKITELFSTIFENFAKTGNPTPAIDEVIKTKWEPVKSDKFEHYYIDDVQEMRAPLFAERFAFWKKVSLEPRNNLKKEEL